MGLADLATAVGLALLFCSKGDAVSISNVHPRRDSDGEIINAHAGGIYQFGDQYYIVGEHYKLCPHSGGNKTIDPLAVGDCEDCGKTGTTFAVYSSPDLQNWTLKSTNILPNKPGGPGANLYTPVLAYNAQHDYYVLLFQCSGGCSDGQLQMATGGTPWGPFMLRGPVHGASDSSQAGIFVDPSTQIAYLTYNSIGDSPANGQWVTQLDSSYLRATNLSRQVVAAHPGSEAGWLEGGGMFYRDGIYYFMAGSGCCYCAGGGGAMVFSAAHPLSEWGFSTNVNPGTYLPFSPTGPPPPPPAVPPGPSPAAGCSDLSGVWASSVLVPNYQPLRAGIRISKISNSEGSMQRYLVQSKLETHWPAIPSAELQVNGTLVSYRSPEATEWVALGSLAAWLNPHANGQVLPPAPNCTMLRFQLPNSPPAIMCKQPYCSETVRPVAAQQFNVVTLATALNESVHLYYGERWQSTPDGLKSHDFSYLEPLRFDSNGVPARLQFTNEFSLDI